MHIHDMHKPAHSVIVIINLSLGTANICHLFQNFMGAKQRDISEHPCEVE